MKKTNDEMRRFIHEAANRMLEGDIEQLGKTYLTGYLNLMLMAIEELKATNAVLIREIKRMNRKLDVIAKIVKNSEKNVGNEMANIRHYVEKIDKEQKTLLSFFYEEGDKDEDREA